MGYDSLLGLCKCKTDDLEEVCDQVCRLKQRMRVSIHCPEQPLEGFVRVENEDRTPKVTVFTLKQYFMFM